MTRKVADRTEQDFWFRRADALRRGKRSEHADGTHSGAAGHFNVLRRIAHVHAMFGRETDAFEGQLEGAGCGFFLPRILATYARGKIISESEFVELAADPGAIPAGDDTEIEFRRKPMQVRRAPGSNGGFSSLYAWAHSRSASSHFERGITRRGIDAMPVWRVMGATSRSVQLISRAWNIER